MLTASSSSHGVLQPGRQLNLAFGHFPSANLPTNCYKRASHAPTLSKKSLVAVLSPRFDETNTGAPFRTPLCCMMVSDE
jgi:hypothetical protein